MSGRGRGGRGHAGRSRGRSRRSRSLKPLKTPLPPSPEPSDTDCTSTQSDKTEHTKNHDSDTTSTPITQTATATSATVAASTAPSENPHSAQTKLNQFLTKPSATSRMAELQKIAAEKAQKRLDKAKANTSKKQPKKSSASKTNKKSAKAQADVSSTDDEDPNDNDDNDKKKKAKSKKPSTSNNYYDPLKQQVSQMSKTERKQYKQIQREHRTYCGVKIDIPDNDNATQTMVVHAAMLLTEIQRIDPRAVIYAFNDEVPIHAIRTPEEIPDNIVTFREFFLNAYPREHKGFIWATIWLGHDKTMKFILENMKFWSKMNSSLIFAKPLQVKNPVREYFLLWSNGRMDKDKLHEAVTRAIDSLTTKKYKFAFSWIALRNSEGNFVRLAKKEPNGNQLVKALHIEVPEDDRDVTYKMMDVIFGLDSEFKILGTTMLMVPIIRDTLPTHKIDDIQHLVIKQKHFLDQLLFIKTQDIAELDYRHPSIGMSIRDMIMELVTLDGKARSIFRSIDAAEKGDAHYLSYPSFLHDHARDMITQLPSLLVWLHGPSVLTMLTAPAQERAKNAPWDPNEMKAISEEDKALKRMLSRAKKMSMYHDGDSDLSSSDEDDDVDEAQIQIEFDREATEEYLFTKASTNQSITSLGTKEKPSKLRSRDSNVNHSNDNDSIDQDDEVSKSDLPSPSKKHKQRTALEQDEQANSEIILNMYRYFELHNIDINNLEVGSVTKATAAAVAGIHQQDVVMKPPPEVEHADAQILLTQEQDRVPPLDMDETPGPPEGLGEGL